VPTPGEPGRSSAGFRPLSASSLGCP
jgi:hypothetical protein